MSKSLYLGAAMVLSVLSGCGDDEGTGAGGAGGSQSGGSGGTSQGGSGGSGAQGGTASTGGSGGAENCTEITIDKLRSNVLILNAKVNETLGAPTEDVFTIGFYPGTNMPVSGMVNLGAAPNNNYGTCKACISVNQDANDTLYFQDRGTLDLGAITFTEDDNEPQFITGGSISNLRLVEVTVDEDLKSTPVPNGKCLTISNLPIEMMAPPAGWTCSLSEYDDGETCNCECDVIDPDCSIPNAPVDGCSGNEMCVAGLCQ